MSVVTWPDGIERGPDGLCRQIPQKHTWSGGVFITQNGTARRRHYNAVTKQWTWDAEPMPMAFDANMDRTGFHVDHWISVDRAIALAWLHRAPDGTSTIVDDGVELVGKKRGPFTIAWRSGEVVGKEERHINGERFKPLRWRCGLCVCPPGYKISNIGRLMNAKGRVTCGLYFAGDRYAAVRDCGLVNLTLAAGLRPNSVDITDSLFLAAEALGTGHTPVDLSRESMVQVGTAWSYMCRVAPLFPSDDLRRHVSTLVSADLWALLQSMAAKGEAVLGGSLMDLRGVVDRRLKRRGAFRSSEFQMEQLRLARLATIAP